MTFRQLFSFNSAGIALLAALTITACGGGGGSAPPPPVPTSHAVNLTWTANREAAVNRAGGGYQVAISGQPVIDVPFPYAASGAAAVATLMSGTYTVTVTAYSAMNSSTGIAALGVVSNSIPSAAFTITVPY
ncbi:MAG: hypothetical protein PXX73_00255 [Sideroxydans sp.]|nr:hypothetical protein [Sideroxydans sp.]